MSEYQEFTGKSVEDAIRQAREAFGVGGLEELDFEILTPGSRGVLGMGAEPARILAAPRSALDGTLPKRDAAASRPLPASIESPREPRPEEGRPERGERPPRSHPAEPSREPGRRPMGPREPGGPGPRTARPSGAPPRRDRDRDRGEGHPTAEPAARPARRTAALSAHEQEEVSAARATGRRPRDESPAVDASPEALAVGKEILEQLMALLGYDVQVTVASGITSKLNVAAQGADKEALGPLIGRKGERLSALQHLLNLMLSRRMGVWTRVLVDVEEYRGRRERQLTELAQQAAEHVVETGKMLQLEPMPALERRWIHLALRDHPGVVTQSIGEEPDRRIVVLRREA